MKKIILLIALFFCTFQYTSAYRIYSEYSKETISSIQNYPQLQNQVDILFGKLEKKINNHNEKKKIQVYNRIQENVVKYKNRYNAVGKGEINSVLDYIYESAGLKIYKVKGGENKQDDLTTYVFGDISDMYEDTSTTQPTIVNENDTTFSQDFEIKGDSKTRATKNNETNITLGSFSVNGYRNNTDLQMWISNNATLQGKVSLYKGSTYITSASPRYDSELQRNVIAFNKINLSPGAYSFKGSMSGIDMSEIIYVTLKHDTIDTTSGFWSLGSHTLSNEDGIGFNILQVGPTDRLVDINKTSNLILGEFRVTGESNNVNFYVWIPEEYTGEYNGEIKLYKGKTLIKTAYPTKGGSTFGFKGISLSEGTYSFQGSIDGLLPEKRLKSFMHYGFGTIPLNSFLGNGKIKITDRTIYSEGNIVGEFMLEGKDMNVERMDVSFSFDNNTRLDFDKGKVYLYDNFGKKIASNSGYHQNENGNEIEVTFRNVYLTRGTYQLQVGDYTINKTSTIRVYIEELISDDILYEGELDGTLLSTVTIPEKLKVGIDAGYIKGNERGLSEIGEFTVNGPGFDINKLELQINASNGVIFDIKKGKVYILGSNLRSVGENSGYSQEDGNQAFATFRDLYLKPGKYTLWVESISVDEETILSTYIKDIDLESSYYQYEDGIPGGDFDTTSMENVLTGSRISTAEIKNITY